jgi:uncharacterized protein
MKNPTREEIEKLYDTYGMYDNIKKHCRQVARIARYLAEEIVQHDVDLPVDEIEQGALLHDIAKTQCLIGKRSGHEKEGAEILRKEGYPELAKYAEMHGCSFLYDEKSTYTWETLPLKYKIIIASDARVKNYTIVSLEERFAYLRERYPDKITYQETVKRYIKEFYAELQSTYGIDPTLSVLMKE